MPTKLTLLPNCLGEPFSKNLLPRVLEEIFPTLSGIIVESEKPGRNYCLQFLSREAFQALTFRQLNEQSSEEEIKNLVSEIDQSKKNWGLVSDAGLCCLADPGSKLISYLQKTNVQIDAIPGPSSIVLALMLSGFSGQKFFFHGYLPREKQELEKQLKAFHLQNKKDPLTHIWIETPYRNIKMIETCIQSLQLEATFCVAINLSLPGQRVFVKKISEWKSMDLNIFAKQPAVFLLS